MNVSESIDWRHAKPWELDLHRFIAITNSGQALDGWLKYFPRAYRHLPARPNRQDNQPLHGRIQIHQRPQGNTETMQGITLVKQTITSVRAIFCISALADGGTR